MLPENLAYLEAGIRFGQLRELVWRLRNKKAALKDLSVWVETACDLLAVSVDDLLLAAPAYRHAFHDALRHVRLVKQLTQSEQLCLDRLGEVTNRIGALIAVSTNDTEIKISPAALHWQLASYLCELTQADAESLLKSELVNGGTPAAKSVTDYLPDKLAITDLLRTTNLNAVFPNPKEQFSVYLPFPDDEFPVWAMIERGLTALHLMEPSKLKRRSLRGVPLFEPGPTECSIHLDGERYQLSLEQAMYVQEVYQARGFVSGGEICNIHPEFDSEHVTRIRQSLPPKILAYIETKKGKGSRWKLD